MRRIYFDCYSGAAGDMLLGALVDVGLSAGELRAALDSLPVGGYRLEVGSVTRQGVTGTRLHVALDGTEDTHRHLADVLAVIDAGGLPPEVAGRAAAVFRRLAEAEAAVHGVPADEVHFHEVGAVDSIVDVIGCVWGLYALGVREVFASPLPLGEGWIDTAHGRLPVPAPATLRLLAGAGAPVRALDVQAELVTPTAAALLAELAVFRRPSLLLDRVGYGFGRRELPWPNAVRAWLGRPPDEPDAGTGPAEFGGAGVEQDTVALLECNLDDTTGEALGYVMERLLAAGALDVWFTPIQMKKNRPAVKLAVLVPPDRSAEAGRLLLSETTTLGVRRTLAGRMKADRGQMSVATPWGTVRAKVKRLDGRPVWAAPEYEDCAALARAAGMPFSQVFAAAQAAALAALGGQGDDATAAARQGGPDDA